jgi:hypothetical protein
MVELLMQGELLYNTVEVRGFEVFAVDFEVSELLGCYCVVVLTGTDVSIVLSNRRVVSTQQPSLT